MMMNTLLIKLLLFGVIAALFQMHGYKGCLEKERTGLLEIKAFFVSVSEIDLDEILPSWVDDTKFDCCHWERVKCNATTGRVMELSLNDTTKFKDRRSLDLFGICFSGYPFLNLNISLLNVFEDLRSLDLLRNCFGGWDYIKAYDTFGSLKQLKILNLGGNNFNASLLPFLTTLTSLETLNLENNSMGDDVKDKQGYESFRSLERLKTLNLGYNKINDSLLPYLTTLSSLKTLILSRNNLPSLISKYALQNLTNLERLDLSNTGLSGSLIWLGLANLTNLKFLDLSSNQINSSLSSLGLGNMGKLEILDLSNNEMNSSLTELGICELKNLVELNFQGNNLDGVLPQCLSNLTYLKVLDLSSNQLSGNLRSVIANITSIIYLDLSYNNFEGVFSFSTLANLSKLEVFLLSAPNTKLQVLESKNWIPTYQLKFLRLRDCNLPAIPSFLLHQYNLQFIDFSNNKLVGTFPTWLLRNNTKLEHIFLRNNSFTGILQLPKSNRALLYLDISENNFIGKLPKNIGFILPKLLTIEMSNNCFEGNVPPSMGEMTGLRVLDLSSNKFSGELPKPFMTGCFSLRFLNLSNNNFHGQIFPKYMNLTSLMFLYLFNNNFSGEIEDGLLKSSSLAVLDISNNKISGEIPYWIGNFSSLSTLWMSKNLLEGNIPIQLSYLENLCILDISENKLSGPISSSFSLPSQINQIYMEKNALNGSIPKELFNSSTLGILDLRDNQFSGSIPQLINARSYLRILLLGGNHLQGHISTQLCQLRNLSILDLSRNRLNEAIPSCFTDMLWWTAEVGNDNYIFDFFDYSFEDDSDTINVGAYYNFALDLRLDQDGFTEFHHPLEVKFRTKNRDEWYQIGILKYMTGIDLSYNNLTGEIPSNIGELKKLHALNLSHNSLSGSIPQRFSHLKIIESLDLSYNKLSGQIPSQLIELYSLAIFNVSYNNLSGRIPEQNQFLTFEESYYGNLGLCGPLLKNSCTDTPALPPSASSGKEEDESAIDKVAFYWSFTGSYVATILGLLLILWINAYWRKLWFYFIDTYIIDFCLHWFSKYVIQPQQ